jgi:hypothetical protein
MQEKFPDYDEQELKNVITSISSEARSKLGDKYVASNPLIKKCSFIDRKAYLRSKKKNNNKKRNSTYSSDESCNQYSNFHKHNNDDIQIIYQNSSQPAYDEEPSINKLNNNNKINYHYNFNTPHINSQNTPRFHFSNLENYEHNYNDQNYQDSSPSTLDGISKRGLNILYFDDHSNVPDLSD